MPDRVAITRPSSGVNPIVVSTDRPPRAAHSDAPAPRWHVTTRSSAVAGRATGGRRGARRTRARARGSRSGGAPSCSRHAAGSAYVDAAGGHRRVEGGVEAGDLTRRRQRRSARDRARRARGAGAAARAPRARRARARPRRRRRPPRGSELPPCTTRCPTAAHAGELAERIGAASCAVALPGRASCCLEPSSSPPSSRSFRLLEPALTTRTRRRVAHGADDHFQSRTSGMSSPNSRVYSTCARRARRPCAGGRSTACAPRPGPGRSRPSPGGSGPCR